MPRTRPRITVPAYPLEWIVEVICPGATLVAPPGGGIWIELTPEICTPIGRRLWYTVRLDMPPSLRDILAVRDVVVRVEGQRDS